ncbi:Uma2 family endonuclease [Anoxybacillus sp. TBDG-1]
MVFPQERKPFTYAEYVQLSDCDRYEIIDGKLYNMTPSPTPKHQQVVTLPSSEFVTHFRGKTCRVFVAPIDVCFSNDEWVQPDIVIVCDPNKIGDERIIGTPDVIVEMLSPSTAKKDRLIKIKYRRYEQAGGPEYWIVAPVHEYVEVHVLRDGAYQLHGTHFKGDAIPVHLFGHFLIHADNIFLSQ